MMHGWMDGYHGMGWGGGLFMLIFWGLAILGVVFLIRFVLDRRRPGEAKGPEETALEILKRRYARGEIIREEYERMRRDLE